MDFTFDELKELYKRFNLKKDIYGEYYILNRNTGIPYSEGLIVDYVKFAYNWVHINRYSRLLNKKDSSLLEQEDYDYAFSEELRNVYDVIMKCSKEVLRMTGEIVNKVSLVEYLEKNGIVKQELLNVVEFMYLDEEFYKMYEIWVRYSSMKIDLYSIKGNIRRRCK